MIKIVALLTSHNRRQKTLACLQALFAGRMPQGCMLEAILVDDASADGTARAVSESFPQVRIIEGNGSLYWNGGMRTAFGAALEQGGDFYLWLNDDTFLYADAVARMIETFHQKNPGGVKEPIIVGTTESRGNPTYGGVRRLIRWGALNTQLVPATTQAEPCDSMNGNCVLISRAIAQAVGNLEPGFTHSMGDLDYGFRATHLGFSIWVMPGFAGACEPNAGVLRWNDARLSMRQRFDALRSPKGLPPREWFMFTRRHGGWLWPLQWCWPYLKLLRPAFLSGASSRQDA